MNSVNFRLLTKSVDIFLPVSMPELYQKKQNNSIDSQTKAAEVNRSLTIFFAEHKINCSRIRTQEEIWQLRKKQQIRKAAIGFLT